MARSNWKHIPFLDCAVSQGSGLLGMMDDLHLKSVVSGFQEHLPPLTCALTQMQVGLVQPQGCVQPQGHTAQLMPHSSRRPQSTFI